MAENAGRVYNLGTMMVAGNEEKIMDLVRQGAEFVIKSKWDSGVLEDEYWAFDGEKFYIGYIDDKLTLEELAARADNTRNCYEVSVLFNGENYFTVTII
jgi:hypothetical protein